MNQVNLVGRVAREVELKHTQGGKAFMFLTIAVDGYFDRKTGQVKSDFIPVIAWGREAEKCRNLLKGSLIRIEGRVNVGKFEKDGKTQYPLDIVAEEITFLSKPREKGSELSGFSA
jgi:single-strand DNA-binding protein